MASSSDRKKPHVISYPPCSGSNARCYDDNYVLLPLWTHGLFKNEWILLTPEGSQNIEMTDTPRCSTRRQVVRRIEGAIDLILN